jgi:hypothetical protein
MFKIRFHQGTGAADETHGETFAVGLLSGPNNTTGACTNSGGANCLALTLDTVQSDTQWTFRTMSNNSTPTKGTTTYAPDTNWHTLYIWNAGVSTEFWFQLDANTTTCFSSAGSGGCTGAGTTIHNALLPQTSVSIYPGIVNIARSANAVTWEIGRVAFVAKGLGTP